MDENCRNAKAHVEGARFVQMLEDLGVLAVIHKFAHLPASTSRSTHKPRGEMKHVSLFRHRYVRVRA